MNPGEERECDVRIESELFSQIRQRGYEEQKMINAPRFSDRHFWGLGKWNPKRAGEWGKGPRMSGPNPTMNLEEIGCARWGLTSVIVFIYINRKVRIKCMRIQFAESDETLGT